MFEAFAIDVSQACSSISRAVQLLRLDWNAAHSIMKRAVDRGLRRRNVEQVERVGIDEKSFLRGHNYVSLKTDIDGSRVSEVSQGRDEEAAETLWKALPESQRLQVKAVAVDMWPTYVNAVKSQSPWVAGRSKSLICGPRCLHA